jgi:hypothetical protein
MTFGEKGFEQVPANTHIKTTKKSTSTEITMNQLPISAPHLDHKGKGITTRFKVNDRALFSYRDARTTKLTNTHTTAKLTNLNTIDENIHGMTIMEPGQELDVAIDTINTETEYTLLEDVGLPMESYTTNLNAEETISTSYTMVQDDKVALKQAPTTLETQSLATVLEVRNASTGVLNVKGHDGGTTKLTEHTTKNQDILRVEALPAEPTHPVNPNPAYSVDVLNTNLGIYTEITNSLNEKVAHLTMTSSECSGLEARAKGVDKVDVTYKGATSCTVTSGPRTEVMQPGITLTFPLPLGEALDWRCGIRGGSVTACSAQATLTLYNKTCAISQGNDPELVVAQCDPVTSSVASSTVEKNWRYGIIYAPDGQYMGIVEDPAQIDLMGFAINSVSHSLNIPQKVTSTSNFVIMIKPDNTKQGMKTMVKQGSILNVFEPTAVVWSGTTEYYPFYFESDSDWSVDVCLEVPAGYEVVEGESCIQSFVAGEAEKLKQSISKLQKLVLSLNLQK